MRRLGSSSFPLKESASRRLIGRDVRLTSPNLDALPPSARGKGGYVRISGGQARGITLQVPRGDTVRPATDGMRQALFSSLGAYTAGARFLDLFAGSGGYGLEALSRGASGGVFVEQNAKAVACLRQNVTAVCKSIGQPTDIVRIVQADARTVPAVDGSDPARLPDLVFIDPPYEMIAEVSAGLFERLAVLLTAKPDALVLFEMPGEQDLEPQGWTRVKRIGKGVRQPTVAIYRRA